MPNPDTGRCAGPGNPDTTPQQADHATRNHQTDRAAIYNRLLDTLPAETG